VKSHNWVVYTLNHRLERAVYPPIDGLDVVDLLIVEEAYARILD
jgi:hypothetical protein